MSTRGYFRLFFASAWLTLAATVLPRSLVAQVTYDNASSGTGTLLPFSFSLTVGTGNQRLLVVAVTYRNGLNLASGVTYGGTRLDRSFEPPATVITRCEARCGT